MPDSKLRRTWRIVPSCGTSTLQLLFLDGRSASQAHAGIRVETGVWHMSAMAYVPGAIPAFACRQAKHGNSSVRMVSRWDRTHDLPNAMQTLYHCATVARSFLWCSQLLRPGFQCCGLLTQPSGHLSTIALFADFYSMRCYTVTRSCR